MNAERLYPIFFSTFQLCWAFIWAIKHLKIRRLRGYANQRMQADANSRYKFVGPLLYLVQNSLCIASFWSNSLILVKVHDGDAIRLIGVLICQSCDSVIFQIVGPSGSQLFALFRFSCAF